MKTEDEILDSEDDREMILHPELWPRWPLLPLTRYTADTVKECGYLDDLYNIYVDGPEKVVIIGFIFDPPKTEEERESRKKHKYADVNALLADGWKVD